MELQERFELALERISQIAKFPEREGMLGRAFQEKAKWLMEASEAVPPNMQWQYFGTGYDVMLELLFSDLNSVALYMAENKTEMALILLELFLEVFFMTGEEEVEENSIQRAIYWTANDYVHEFAECVRSNARNENRMAYNSFEQLAEDCIKLADGTEEDCEAFYKQVPYKKYVLYFDKRLVEHMTAALKTRR